ncbi:MAG: DNA polymerase V [Thiomicrorhabdus sp.]|nr:MAG: DNA polymerase V [Thiomicrorhabdus sp.]
MPVYALVDGNSFYASCQIAFNPALKNRPVVVLSNNDGCVVAANDLAKNINQQIQKPFGQGGYKSTTQNSIMFQPYFKVAPLLKKNNAVIFSSNYELYGDMSQRMHRITAEFAAKQEIYSIDESFLDFSNMPHHDLTEHAQKLKKRVHQWIGIPVAVGIGSTKTLAKLANHLAKKKPELNGVLDLTSLSDSSKDTLFKQIKVGSIWGVGKQLAQQLNHQNILTAFDLKYCHSTTIHQQFSVNVERIVLELNGQACLKLEDHLIKDAPNKQQILSSRSFGQLIEEFDEMRQAVTSYTAVAAEKLRKQQSLCKTLTVAITTPPFRENIQQYSNQISVPLIYPTDNTLLLSKIAIHALKQIWQPKFQYLKASITLSQLSERGALQIDLFAPNPQFSGSPKSDKLMQVLDQINKKLGKGAIQVASSGLEHPTWQMNRNLMSPRYTTRWNELQVVKS